MGIFEQWLPDPGRFERVNAVGAANVVAAAREAGRRPRRPHLDLRRLRGRARRHGERGAAGRRAEADRVRALQAARRGARARRGRARDRGRDLQPGRGLRPGAVGRCRARPGVSRRAPRAAAGRPARRDDARLRRRRRRRPPRRASTAAGPGERYILADGYASMRELFAAVVEAGGRGRVPPRMPAALAKLVAVAGEARLARDPPPAADRQGRADLPALGGARRQLQGSRGARVEFTPWREGVGARSSGSRCVRPRTRRRSSSASGR